MKNYMFLFRGNYATLLNASPEEMQARTKAWMDWVGGIAAQNKLLESGNRLATDGKVVRPGNVITDGPYTEVKESVLGYTIIKAESYEAACQIAQGCPALQAGGNVEVREISMVQ
ncbi:MAG TPA: YciI family protein [Chitinophaga sp.]